MNEILVENVSNFDKPGINISSDIDWQLHIHLKVNKKNSMLAFIKRTYGYSPMPDAKRMLYLTLIRSGLLYGSTVWYPNKACEKLLEGVQRRATKYILDYLMMTSLNGSIFRVTGPLSGEFTGDRCIPLTKASDAELWCFLLSAPEKRVE